MPEEPNKHDEPTNIPLDFGQAVEGLMRVKWENKRESEMQKNPIIEKLTDLTEDGVEVIRIFGKGLIDETPRRVGFDLKDGTQEYLKISVDRNEYMKLWKQAARFKSLLSKTEIPENPDD